MSKYDFIKQGNLLFWHTADNDIECRIISTPEKVDSDSIILVATGSSEIEVLASELSPIGSSRSHKEEFLRWKKEREAEGMEFFSRLSEVMETDSGLAVGDMVAFTNDYGVVFGPKEVLAFRKPWNGGRCVYIDSDAYWFPDRPGQLTILSKGGAEWQQPAYSNDFAAILPQVVSTGKNTARHNFTSGGRFVLPLCIAHTDR